MPSDDETVTVSSNADTRSSHHSGGVYHTDPDCHRLSNASTTEKSVEQAERMGLVECQWCAGEVETGTEGLSIGEKIKYGKL